MGEDHYMKIWGKLFFVKIAKVLTVVLVGLLMTGIVTESAYGDEVPVVQVPVNIAGKGLSTISYDDFNDKKIASPSEPITFRSSDDVSTSPKEMVKDTPYSATFNLNYYGTPLVAVVTVKLINSSPYGGNTDNTNKVFIDGDGLLAIEWNHSTSEVEWKIELYEADDSALGYNTNKSYLKYFLVGFYDPDESSYYFDTDNRSLYYKDAGPKGLYTKDTTAANYFLYRTVGASGTTGIIKSDDDPAVNFAEAIFVVSVPNSDTDFEFTSSTLNVGSLTVPRLYSRKYNITYDYNDEKGSTKATRVDNPTYYATSPNIVSVVNNPTRVGYKFLGWNNETDNPTTGEVPTNYKTTIDAEKSGDKEFKAYWEPLTYNVLYDANPASVGATEAKGDTADQIGVKFDENKTLTKNGYSIYGYKFIGWSLESGKQSVVYNDENPYVNLFDKTETGEPDLEHPITLYAQWETIKYSIKYDPNAEDATGEMETNPQTDREFNVEYSLLPNKYSREGYDWIGWSLESGKQPVKFGDEAKYTNLFNNTESGDPDLEHPVTLYAQWNPWLYTIKYDANGGSGSMPDQVFEYSAENMKSKENSFTRDGYRFVGFDYTDNEGNKLRITSISDFKKLLIERGKNTSVTLVAQWEKIPEARTKTYYIPVTGIK